MQWNVSSPFSSSFHSFLPYLLDEQELRVVGVGRLLLLRRRHLVQAAVVLRPSVGIHRRYNTFCSGTTMVRRILWSLLLTGVVAAAVSIARLSTVIGASSAAQSSPCNLPKSGTHHIRPVRRVRVVIDALRVGEEHPVIVGMGRNWTESWWLRSTLGAGILLPALCGGR